MVPPPGAGWSDRRPVAAPLRRIDVDIDVTEALADHAVVERGDIDLLQLRNVLVDVDVDVGQRTGGANAAQPRVAAADGGKRAAVEVLAERKVANDDGRHDGLLGAGRIRRGWWRSGWCRRRCAGGPGRPSR